MSKKNKSTLTARSVPGLFSGPPVTDRQKEISHEIGRPIFLWWLEYVATNEMERAKIAEARRAYEKVLFGRPNKNRLASEFLWRWQNAKMYQGESTQPESTAKMPMRLVFLAPLLNALNALDAEFFERLAKAMRRALSEREKVKKRLIEIDELVHPTGQVPTWREIWQKHCPDHIDTPSNFQKLLKECGIQFEKVGEFRRKEPLKRVRKR
jgi:hypothetical protein